MRWYNVGVSKDGQVIARTSWADDPGLCMSGSFLEIIGQNWKTLAVVGPETLGHHNCSGIAVEVSSDGRRVAVGAPHETVNGLMRVGCVYLFDFDYSQVTQVVRNGQRVSEAVYTVTRLEPPQVKADLQFGDSLLFTDDRRLEIDSLGPFYIAQQTGEGWTVTLSDL
jgi:hypothetical protein